MLCVGFAFFNVPQVLRFFCVLFFNIFFASCESSPTPGSGLAPSPPPVPLRLTQVLRDSLGGNCKTVMIATAHSIDAVMDESIST